MIINEVSPLQAVWAPVGTQACVPIIAAHDRRVLTTVFNVQTGISILTSTAQYTQDEFQAILSLIRQHWSGWRTVLFVDKHSAQTARGSRRLAHQLGIQLRWLPKACPELNPVDHLWRHLTRDVLANEPMPTLDGTVQQIFVYRWSLTPRERLRQAGVLSADFWLADLRH